MKTLIILVQVLCVVNPRGLDPKHLSDKKIPKVKEDDGEGVIKKTLEGPVKPTFVDEFTFIRSFLSSNPHDMPPKLLDDGSSVEENDTHEDYNGNPREEESSSNLEHIDMSRSYGRGGRAHERSDGPQSHQLHSPNGNNVSMGIDAFMSAFLSTHVKDEKPHVLQDHNQTSSEETDKQKDNHDSDGDGIDDITVLNDTTYGRDSNDKFLFSNQVLLTPAQDRQLLIPFNPVDRAFVEAKYQSIITDLPSVIDNARSVIIRDKAIKNMLGYTIAGSYILGAFLDTVGVALLEKSGFGPTLVGIVTDKADAGLIWYLWWYAFGYGGPWYFPNIFSGGDPNLQCSSAEFFELISDHGLTLNIQSFTAAAPGAAAVLKERLVRDFNSRLGCIVHKRGDYKEAAAVSQLFEMMLFLTDLHVQLQPDTSPLPRIGAADISTLDAELMNIWAEIIVLTDQVIDHHPIIFYL